MARSTAPGPMWAMVAPSVAMWRWRAKLSRIRASSTLGTALLSRRRGVLPAAHELVQLLSIEVGYRPELHPRRPTVRQVEALTYDSRAPNAARRGVAGPEQQVDPVRP